MILQINVPIPLYYPELNAIKTKDLSLYFTHHAFIMFETLQNTVCISSR